MNIFVIILLLLVGLLAGAFLATFLIFCTCENAIAFALETRMRELESENEDES